MPRQRRSHPVYNSERRSLAPRDSVEKPCTRCQESDCIIYFWVKLFTLLLILLIVIAIPLGQRLYVIQECDTDLHCILCNIYIFLLRVTLRLMAIAEFLCKFFLKAFEVVNIKIVRLLQKGESTCSVAPCLQTIAKKWFVGFVGNRFVSYNFGSKLASLCFYYFQRTSEDVPDKSAFTNIIVSDFLQIPTWGHETGVKLIVNAFDLVSQPLYMARAIFAPNASGMASVNIWLRLIVLILAISAAYSENAPKPDDVHQEVDKVIEDEITSKLSRDLAQSIEKKFHVDLEKSVNMVLQKIQLLLQNGTTHILERLSDLQGQLDDIRKSTGTELDNCLKERENETAQLAEKAMHQMVVCGYALIGHNPSQAVGAVVDMKNMIKTRLQPIREQKKELDELLKACGHEHDSLKKVIKCVIAKSPIVKSTMMDVTNQLLQGVVELTKVLAHGAMHEACLIEVIKTVEDDAFAIVNQVRNCAFGNITNDATKYLEANNATVLDVPRRSRKFKIDPSKKEIVEMKQLIRRMLSDANTDDLDKRFKKKLKKLQDDLESGETNATTTVKNVAANANADLNTTSVVTNVISNDI